MVEWVEGTVKAVTRQFSMKILFTLFLICSFLFPQEPCEGTCLSQNELGEIINDMKNLEFDLEKSLKINENLKNQINLYIEQHANDSLLIDLNMQKSTLLDNRIKLYDELIKEVKPKWYENKWLWFTIGALTTAGSVKLAGEIID